jgi:hypothetical protein
MTQMLNKIKERFFNKEFKKLKPKIGVVSEIDYLMNAGLDQKQGVAIINVILTLTKEYK